MRITRSNVVSGVTLLALTAVVCAMAAWGFAKTTAPFPKRATTTSSGPSCSAAERDVKTFIARNEIRVSVYNASGRKGLASNVLNRLELQRFLPGETGNAPQGTSVPVAEVWTDRADDSAAQLVAQVMGPGVRVVRQAEGYGPGVDVVVGAGFKRLNRQAPMRIQLPEPIVTCIEVD